MTEILTDRFDDALSFSVQLHRDQYRKGTQIPYVSHLLSVAGLVLEAGGDEEQAISALLHDAVEDQGGLEILEEIRERFGDRVADIVDSCTDAYTTPKPAWKERKNKYLIHAYTGRFMGNTGVQPGQDTGFGDQPHIHPHRRPPEFQRRYGEMSVLSSTNLVHFLGVVERILR